MTTGSVESLRDFLTVYNTLTEECFSACVTDFNHRTINPAESNCIYNCINKLMNANSMDILSEHGYRQDGRKPGDLRKVVCKMGVYQQADGSAYLEQGSTKVLCAVYGPHEPKKGRAMGKGSGDKCRINCQFSAATFSTSERKHRPRGDRKSHECSQLLQKTFEAAVLSELFSNSQIDIFCEVLQSDGGQLAACVNAASLALVDAGVPMKGVVCACTCTCVGDVCVVDTCNSEESGRNATLTIGLLPRTEEIVLLELQSRLHIDAVDPIIDATKKACKDLHSVLDVSIREQINDTAALLGWDNQE